MKPETTGVDLLLAVEQTLSRDLAPTLTGEPRFKALMAASAIRMVMREMRGGAELAGAMERLGSGQAISALAAAIRRGDHDASDDVFGRLVAAARLRAEMFKPTSPT